ncbi:hypothetical protein, partial [Nonomuraea zeae]
GHRGGGGDTDGHAERDAGRDTEAVRRGVRRTGVITGIRLGDGVRLVLDTGRTPSAEDVQAVLAAAGPLLAVLEERDLT